MLAARPPSPSQAQLGSVGRLMRLDPPCKPIPMMRSLFRRRLAGTSSWTAHPVAYVLAWAVLCTAMCLPPLWRYLASHLDLGTSFGWMTALAVMLLPVTLTVLLLALAALASRALLKLVTALVLLGNALALYFMEQYGAVLDSTMMGNVLNTNPAEAGALWHPMLIVYLLGFGLLPGGMAQRWRLRAVPRWHMAVAVLTLPSACVLLIYLLSSTWLWIDQHAGAVGARMLPWSYVINTARHLQQQAGARQTFEPLPAAQPAALVAGRRQVAVLVIGESARADRLRLYGYERDTNAHTTGLSVVAVPGVRACASYTVAALNCILSHKGHTAPSRADMDEPLPSYLQRQGVDVIWRSANSGEPALKVRWLERAAELARNCVGADCSEADWDGILLHQLRERVEQSQAQRVLVVLHLSGSHGPAYHRKVPPGFARFEPVCQTVVLKDCEPQALSNAYDNSIAYTDHVLARLTRLLQGTDWASAWLYLSDHGESLGESGLYLHGTPGLLAPREQLEIPMLMWFSEAGRQALGVDPARIPRLREVGQGHVFHTVMGMLALQGGPYQASRDVLTQLR